MGVRPVPGRIPDFLNCRPRGNIQPKHRHTPFTQTHTVHTLSIHRHTHRTYQDTPHTQTHTRDNMATSLCFSLKCSNV